jgi:aspartate aminotransferase
MTGWRIGYAAGPSKIIAAMKKIQSQSTSNPCSISQYATEIALNGDQNCIAVMTKAYKERHDVILNALREMPGVNCLPSDGTFYSFPNMEGVIKKAANISNDLELTEYFLQEAQVAMVPGSAFGMPGYVRISYAASMEKIKEAMKRLSTAIIKL